MPPRGAHIYSEVVHGLPPTSVHNEITTLWVVVTIEGESKRVQVSSRSLTLVPISIPRSAKQLVLPLCFNVR